MATEKRIIIEFGPDIRVTIAMVGDPPENLLPPSYSYKEEEVVGSTSDRIREIADAVLADGRVHERREISQACRKAGVNPTGIVSALRNRYDENKNMDGRPTYRDPSVPSGYAKPEGVAAASHGMNGGHGDG